MRRGSDGVRRALADCRSYKLTTVMLVAIGSMFRNHFGASVGIGRAVRRISADGAAVPDPVTPDMMVQGRGLNVVVEIKAGFPSGARARQKILDQLKKYDCRLVGWLEKNVSEHDIMVVTRLEDAAEMSGYLQKKTSVGEDVFSNPLCVVEFAQPVGVKRSFFVKTVSGNPTNKGLRSYMENGAEISVGSVSLAFSTLWFYDSEPIPPYTMVVIWEKIFSEIYRKMADGRAYRQETVLLRTTVDEVMDEFRALAVSMPTAPRRRWIAKGMDGLVKIGMARKGADGAYIIDYSAIEGEDLLEVFARKWVSAQSGDPQGHA